MVARARKTEAPTATEVAARYDVPARWVNYCEWLADAVTSELLTDADAQCMWTTIAFFNCYLPNLPAPHDRLIDEDGIIVNSWEHGPHAFRLIYKERSTVLCYRNPEQEIHDHRVMVGGAVMNQTIADQLCDSANLPRIRLRSEEDHS